MFEMRTYGKVILGIAGRRRSNLTKSMATGLVALLSACGSSSDSAPAPDGLNPAVSPGGNFALDHFALTIPVDASGGTTGEAVTIPSSQLVGPTGYSLEWFYTGADGSMTFWTPHNGAALAEAPHPRCEFHEQIVEGSDISNWNETGTSILDAQLKVLQVPSDNEVIVGQVHGYTVGPLVLVFYRYDPAAGFGQLIGLYHSDPTLGSSFTEYVLLDGLAENTMFTYQIEVNNGIVSFSANGTLKQSITMDPSWVAQTFYFKAGSYLNSSTATDADGGRVSFYKLSASHPS